MLGLWLPWVGWAEDIEARSSDGRVFVLHPDGTYTEQASADTVYLRLSPTELHTHLANMVGRLVEVRGNIAFMGGITITPLGRTLPIISGIESEQLTLDERIFLRNYCVLGCAMTIRGEVVDRYGVREQLGVEIHRIMR